WCVPESRRRGPHLRASVGMTGRTVRTCQGLPVRNRHINPLELPPQALWTGAELPHRQVRRELFPLGIGRFSAGRPRLLPGRLRRNVRLLVVGQEVQYLLEVGRYAVVHTGHTERDGGLDVLRPVVDEQTSAGS